MSFFSPSEVENLDPRLVSMLEMARGYAKVPFIITSGYRDPEHNHAIGGVPGSAHTKGLAVDIRCEGSMTRFLIVSAALLAGFERIEIGTRHIHLDIDPTKPQKVMWLGDSH